MTQARKSQRRGSRKSTVGSKRGMEFTKKIVIFAAILFIISFLDIRGAVREGLDVSGYATQVIVTTGGIFGASIIFYLNKSKIENLSKGKIRFMLLRLRLELKLKDQIPEEVRYDINSFYNTFGYLIGVCISHYRGGKEVSG